jgi:hypothetical protein
MKIDKKCSCGKRFLSLPENHKKNELGYWFNCSCGSTLLVRTKDKNEAN